MAIQKPQHCLLRCVHAVYYSVNALLFKNSVIVGYLSNTKIMKYPIFGISISVHPGTKDKGVAMKEKTKLIMVVLALGDYTENVSHSLLANSSCLQ